MSRATRGMVVLCFLAAVIPAQAEKQIRQIKIRSHWGGLGPRADATVVISRTRDGYEWENQTVAPALVEALVSSLQSSPIPKPDLQAFGITPSWLASHVSVQRPRSHGDPGKNTPGQLALFRNSFTDLKLIERLLPELFQNTHTDDYPSARVEVSFDDGSNLVAYSNSQFAYMLPWCVGPEKKTSYNPDVSRAIAALLPPKTVNRERLAEADLAAELSEAIMSEIEAEFDLRGAEDRVGPDLQRLRRSYQITTATIDASLRPEYGPKKYNAKHEQVNLHATLHRSTLPLNVFDDLTLLDLHGHVQGIDQFLSTGGKYEQLVLSIPWLTSYIASHPATQVRITYVHDASMGEDAFRNFAADMKVRERSDLIEKVKAQRSQIALIQVGELYSESYWLVFPDKHLLLWRYQGPSGLLKWKPSDFGEGDCDEYGINDGGCSGREVSSEGVLVSEGTPHDVACVSAWRAEHSHLSSSPDALFEVVEHDREGFIDRSGAVVIPLCFQGVQGFSEGLAPFERDGRWGYINSAGDVVIQPVFPWAEEFHEGLAHVQIDGSTLGLDGKWGYIERSGNVVIPPSFPQVMGDSEGNEAAFHEGFAMVEIWDERIPPRKGFIDHSGKLVIPARFTYAEPFSEGLAAVTESPHGDSGWGFIDKNGSWIVPPKFDWASSFTLGLAPVNRKRDCGYIDKTGAQVLKLDAPPPSEDCASAWGDFKDGLSRWLFGSKYGFIDRSGKTTIKPQFDLTFGFSEGLAAVEVGKRWGFIDTTGEFVIPLQGFSDVKPFHHGLSRVILEEQGVGYIDRTGKFVWGPHKQSDK